MLSPKPKQDTGVISRVRNKTIDKVDDLVWRLNQVPHNIACRLKQRPIIGFLFDEVREMKEYNIKWLYWTLQNSLSLLLKVVRESPVHQLNPLVPRPSYSPGVPGYEINTYSETMFSLTKYLRWPRYVIGVCLFFRSQKHARKLFLLIVSFTSGL